MFESVYTKYSLDNFQYFLKDPVKYDVKYQVFSFIELQHNWITLRFSKRPAISCAWPFGDCFSNQPLYFQLGLYKMMLWRVLLNKFKNQCCRFGLAIV
uniref:Uncharacterized protein n=1 Tax=Quercus lobata TaxID=97700 RepID=A0A7N2MMX3_QUELO